jgi:hypothetical protein
MLEVMDPSGLLDSPVFVIAGVAKSDESSGISGIGHVREEIRPEIICAVIDREPLTFGASHRCRSHRIRRSRPAYGSAESW